MTSATTEGPGGIWTDDSGPPTTPCEDHISGRRGTSNLKCRKESINISRWDGSIAEEQHTSHNQVDYIHIPLLCALKHGYLGIDRHPIHQPLPSVHPSEKIKKIIFMSKRVSINGYSTVRIVWFKQFMHGINQPGFGIDVPGK